MQTIDPDSRPLIARAENGEKLVVARLESDESIDNLFEHKALVLGQNLDEIALLGQGITFCYQPEQASSRMKVRYFHGFCVQINQVGQLDSHHYQQYEILAAPWAWFLTRRENCRIFQQQKASEIITAICREHGFHGFLDLKTSGDQKREYCVQYNETDWAFICRLMASEGWFYFFSQQEGKHQLIVGQNNRLFADSGESGVEYFAGSSKLERAITQWTHNYQMLSGAVASASYNYELAQPIAGDEVKSKQNLSHRQLLRKYFYPGDYQDKNQGKEFNGNIQSGIDTRLSEAKGESTLLRFAAGTTFFLEHHPDKNEQKKYLLRQVSHSLITLEDGRSTEYHNQFFCLPADTPWKAGKLLPKPVMASIQSARVTGPDNEEMYLDKHHRIKVQFHWDREGGNNQNSSCWVRVAQPVTGNGFGCQLTPRVGDEVLVCFMDADPDQPLVIGSVYNGRHQQPFNNTPEQGLRLRSFPKAGADNFSELSFNCKKDEERLFMQAEKDMSVLVKNDAERTVQGNNKLIVEKNSEREVKENDSHKIEGEQSTEVTKTINTRTDADYQLTTRENFQQDTKGDYNLRVQGKTTADSTGDMDISSKGNLSETATNTIAMEATAINGKGKTGIELTVGASKISLSNSSVEISCGPGTVKLSPSGVEISAMQVKVEGQVMAQMKAGVSASVEGTVNTEVKGTLVTINGNAMTSVKAGALVELSGAIAKIN